MGFLANVRQANGFEPASKGYVGQVDSDFFVRALTLKEAVANFSAGSIGDIGNAYQNDAIVYSAIRACARNLCQVPFLMYTGDDKDPKLLEKSPWYTLFERPNPLMSKAQLWEATEIYMKLRGEAIWVLEFGGKYMNGQIPMEIYPLDPSCFKHLVDEETKLIAAWEYRDERGNKILFEHGVEIIHFKRFNPYDRYRGLSELQAAAIAIRMGGSARNYNAVTLQNMGEPGGILSTEAKLTAEQVMALREQFEARHQGYNKAKRVAVLHSGLSYEQVGLTPRDMEFKEVMNMSVEDILAVLSVPKTEVFRYDDVRKETAEVQDKALWTKNLVPEMAYFEDELWAQCFSQRADRQTYGLFDLSAIPALQDDEEAKGRAAKVYFDMGYPVNMINKRFKLGMEDVPWGNMGYLPMALIPVDMLGEQPSMQEPEEPDDDEEDDDEEDVDSEEPKEDDDKDDEKRLTRPRLLDAKSARRRAGARSFERRLRPLEARFASTLKRVFFQMRKEVLDAYLQDTRGVSTALTVKDSLENKITVILNRHKSKLKTVSEPHLKAAIHEGGARLSEFGIQFNLTNGQAHELLGQHTGKITKITKTIELQIRKQMARGYEEQETTSQIADRIRTVFNFASKRSMTIARTEMSNAANQAGVQTERNAGVLKHEWATAHDEAVRDSHQDVDGEIVPLDQPFSNGLMYPGDPAGPPEEVINCRCTPIPVFDE